MYLLNLILWWGVLPLQAVLLFILSRKRAFDAFPCFFAYTLFSVFAGLARFLLRGYHDIFFWVYWGTDAVYSLLGVAVMYEVFQVAFRSFRHIWWFRLIFPATVIGAAILTLVRAKSVPAGPHIRIVQVVVTGEMGVRFLQVAMFVLLVGLVALFGLHWRQQAFGICAGYGLYATVSLLSTTKFYEFGKTFALMWYGISVAAYTLSVLIWLWYFTGPLETEPPRADHPPLSAQELDRYKEIVRKVQRP
jgi:hypothetical protein